MLLAIDTATQFMSLALYDGHSLVAEQTWRTVNNHSVQLAPTIDAILARSDATPSDIKALAVCTGPGTYSGLRVGVSLAKGLASVRRLPLVGLSALDVLAAGQSHYSDTLIVVVQAGRGRVAVGRYQWRKGRWSTRGDAQLMDWETLLNSVDGAAHLTGEINEAGFEAIKVAQERGVTVTLVPAGYRLRRAGFLAQEAWERYQSNPTGFPANQVTPFYIKTQDVPES